MVHGDDAFLHVHAGTHVLCTTDKDADAAFIHLCEQCLALLVGVGNMYVGNLITRYAVVIHKAVDDVGIGIVLLSLGRYACIAEDKLCAFLLLELVVNLLDLLADGWYLASLVLVGIINQSWVDGCFC